jgi:hypothetical protein
MRCRCEEAISALRAAILCKSVLPQNPSNAEHASAVCSSSIQPIRCARCYATAHIEQTIKSLDCFSASGTPGVYLQNDLIGRTAIL